MISRNELNDWLKNTFSYENFEDYCFNGLQVEGGDEINKIGFAVSFNSLLAERALIKKYDALIVHHGFFGKNLFQFSGVLKKKIMLLMQGNTSLFGIHLPLDAHPEIGNNAVLLSWLNCDNLHPFEVGFTANNAANYSIKDMLQIFELNLGNHGHCKETEKLSPLTPQIVNGSQAWLYGPKTPKKIACVSGGASDLIEKAAAAGADTYICGEVKEQTPAIAMDLGMNFINLGHYRSEKAGVQALMQKINTKFDVDCEFIDIVNVI
ncbi:MAG: Nif3-like dinuclear metal center hexameric protein [Candidatus Marinimicrobia bacterium]|nr:Nif3-like dinuclear metal center hexameric protein [Candidatus Neomarinimicrobiota bacterium]